MRIDVEFIIVDVSKKTKSQRDNLIFSINVWYNIYNFHFPKLAEKLNIKFSREELIHGEIEKLKINSIIKINSN